MEPANYDKGAAYCVGGNMYYPNYPVRCFRWLIFLPAVAFLVTGDWHQLSGTIMVLLGLIAANARFSPVHGCLVWIPLIAVAIWGMSQPEFAVPLMAWGAIVWLAGCIECRLALVPHEQFNKDAAKS